MGESGGMGENNGENTGYLERERNLSSDMEEKICEGEKGKGKTRGRFANDCIT